MNIFILIFTTLLTFKVFAIDPNQKLSLDGSNRAYYAKYQLKEGTLILTRTHQTRESVSVDIIRNTGDFKVSYIGGGLQLNKSTGSSNFSINRGKEIKTPIYDRKRLNLDFMEAKKLEKDEIERIIFSLEFINDEINVADIEVLNDHSSCYNIKGPSFFDKLDPSEDDYQFIFQQ